MNSNFAQDDQGRLLAVLDDANVTLNVKTDGNTVASEIAHPIADLGGQDAVVVAVANTATVNVQDTVDVEVQNWPPDPASGTNQLAIIGKLPNPIAGKIPVDASGNVVPVSQSGSWAVFVNNVSLPLPTGAATETTLASLLALTGTSLGPWVDHDPVTVAAEPSAAHTKLKIPIGTAQLYAGDDCAFDFAPEEKQSFKKIETQISLQAKPVYKRQIKGEWAEFCGMIITPLGVMKDPIKTWASLELAARRGEIKEVKDSYARDVALAYQHKDRLHEIFSEEQSMAHQLTVRKLIKVGSGKVFSTYD